MGPATPVRGPRGVDASALRAFPDPSFPSDHAAAAFAIAFCVLAFSRWAGVGFLSAATLIGLSRIALGMHYPSDVLAGLLVGWAAALLVVQLGRPTIERVTAFAGRVSDPVVAPVWRRAASWVSESAAAARRARSGSRA